MITKSLFNLLSIITFSTVLLGCSNSNTLSSDTLFGIGKPKACHGVFTPLNTNKISSNDREKGQYYVR